MHASRPADAGTDATRAASGRPRTIVYVDGFNLYYGALKGTAFRWLDLAAFARNLLPRNDVVAVRYCTARVKPRDGDHTGAVHQATYLRALATLPMVDVLLGQYVSRVVRLPVAGPDGNVLRVDGRKEFASVIKDEEKGSDVQLATRLVHDAHLRRFEVAVVVSNDSDLAPPIRLVREELGLVVGVANPHRTQSVELRQLADFLRPVRSSVLGNSQLPDEVSDATGTFRKPPNW